MISSTATKRAPGAVKGGALPIDVPLLRTVHQASDSVLMEFAKGVSVPGDSTVIVGLVELFKQDGVVLTGLLGSQSGIRALADLLIDGLPALPMAEMDAATRALGLELTAGLQRALGASNSKAFANAVLVRAAREVGDRAFFEGLLALGATRGARGSAGIDGKYGDDGVWHLAAMRGNVVALRALMPGAQELEQHGLGGLVMPFSEFGGAPSSPLGLSIALRDHPSLTAEFLSDLDALCGVHATTQVRARMLSYYLHSCVTEGRRWSPAAIEVAIGRSGSATYEAMAVQAAKDVDTVRDSNKGPGVPWEELYHHALASHCAPVLQIFTTRLRADANLDYRTKEDPLFRVLYGGEPKGGGGHASSAGRSSAIVRQAVCPTQFTETIEALLACGHRIDRHETGHPPALVLLAKSANPPAVKLEMARVLLELGAHPSQSFLGRPAWASLQPGEKEAWDDLLRSFSAREAASRAIGTLLALP
ncbi:hypothetical protein ACSFA0_25420 [Variovorax sp. LT1P1]|uniref:hypothetical protein n=1 Tax=Variovorax sp. LT1P1 TaxID=3443730 RepID=UPI003F48D4C9